MPRRDKILKKCRVEGILVDAMSRWKVRSVHTGESWNDDAILLARDFLPGEFFLLIPDPLIWQIHGKFFFLGRSPSIYCIVGTFPVKEGYLYALLMC